jgi:hypothetical protein
MQKDIHHYMLITHLITSHYSPLTTHHSQFTLYPVGELSHMDESWQVEPLPFTFLPFHETYLSPSNDLYQRNKGIN